MASVRRGAPTSEPRLGFWFTGRGGCWYWRWLNALRSFWIEDSRDKEVELAPPWRLAHATVTSSYDDAAVVNALRGFVWSGSGDRRCPLDGRETYREDSRRLCEPTDLELETLPAKASWFSGTLVIAAEPGFPLIDDGVEVGVSHTVYLVVENGVVLSEAALD
ncbi:MAG: hypothetical protein HYX32_06645 [Actinobacteria bacterium]|nr:hypothetical protein [Actinomycetota bacterium]